MSNEAKIFNFLKLKHLNNPLNVNCLSQKAFYKLLLIAAERL